MAADRLVKGMYGSEFDRTGDLFGIRCGQMRSQDLVHNGGWYNKEGEKIGWGDLNEKDLTHIRDLLLDGEVFIILGEGDSFWKHVVHNPGPIGAFAKTTPTADAPGKAFVAEHARYYIVKGFIYRVIGEYDSQTKQGDVRGVVTYMRRKALMTLLNK